MGCTAPWSSRRVEVSVGEEPAEVAVAVRRGGKQGEVVPLLQGQLRSGDRSQSPSTARLRELHGAVQPIVVGQRQSAIAEPLGLEDQLLDGGGALQERPVAVAMELHIVRHGW